MGALRDILLLAGWGSCRGNLRLPGALGVPMRRTLQLRTAREGPRGLLGL